MNNKKREQPFVADESLKKEPISESGEVQVDHNLDTELTAEFHGKLGQIFSSLEDQHSESARERRLNPEGKDFDEIKRETDVFYIPDIHGDVVALRQSLSALGLIDENDNWIGDNKVLQFSGD